LVLEKELFYSAVVFRDRYLIAILFEIKIDRTAEVVRQANLKRLHERVLELLFAALEVKQRV
jgi:hypothetical protein